MQGVTLLELLAAMSLLAWLSFLAFPNWQSFQRSHLLNTTAQHFVAAINAARSEGMKRNLPALVTPRDGKNNWHSGWYVFVDVDWSGDYSTNDLLILESPPLPGTLHLRGNGMAGQSPSYIRYDGSGFAKDKHGAFGATTLSLGFCATHCSGTTPVFDAVRHIKIASTGRLRICNPHIDTSCTASLDS